MSNFNKSELERLVAVETKLETVIEQGKELKGLLTDVLTSYVPRSEYELEMTALRKDIAETRKRSALINWLTGTLSAVFGVVMTILITAYFNN